MKKHVLQLLLAASVMHVCAAQAAPTIAEVQPLTFGEVSVGGVSGVHSVTMTPAGSETYDPEIISMLPGRNGVFLMSGFDPSTVLTVSIADTTLSYGGSIFDIKDFTFDPAQIGQVTDAMGQLSVAVGATMSTRTGASYGDGPYRGSYTFMVSYN